jgi:hypothetical protein
MEVLGSAGVNIPQGEVGGLVQQAATLRARGYINSTLLPVIKDPKSTLGAREWAKGQMQAIVRQYPFLAQEMPQWNAETPTSPDEEAVGQSESARRFVISRYQFYLGQKMSPKKAWELAQEESSMFYPLANPHVSTPLHPEAQEDWWERQAKGKGDSTQLDMNMLRGVQLWIDEYTRQSKQPQYQGKDGPDKLAHVMTRWSENNLDEDSKGYVNMAFYQGDQLNPTAIADQATKIEGEIMGDYRAINRKGDVPQDRPPKQPTTFPGTGDPQGGYGYGSVPHLTAPGISAPKSWTLPSAPSITPPGPNPATSQPQPQPTVFGGTGPALASGRDTLLDALSSIISGAKKGPFPNQPKLFGPDLPPQSP